MKPSLKFAITGATGFIGGHLTEALLKAGHEVTAICRENTPAGGRARRDRLTWAPLNLSDGPGLSAAMAGCEAVVHCAGITRERGLDTYARVHEEATESVVEAARRAGVNRMVLTSFLRARPDCGSPYHESKWRAEETVRLSGLEYVILKMGVVYGQGDHMLDHLSRALLTLPVFGLIGHRDQPVRPVAVEDVVRILLSTLIERQMRWRTLAVTGPEELTLREVVERVAAVVGKHPRIIRLPIGLHFGFARIGERMMRRPLISRAQVRILSESLVEALPYANPLPNELLPRTAFTEEAIRRGLPEKKAFGLADLRLFRTGEKWNRLSKPAAH